MRLCDYCVKNILESEESWDYHRCYDCLTASSEWVVPAADKPTRFQEPTKKPEKKERCLFCSTLRNDIETIEPEWKSRDGPVYRWNKRSLAQIRESLATVVVTFRPIPVAKKEGDVVVEEIHLPTRTFYLFPEHEMGPLPNVQELGTSTNPAVNGGHQIKSWVETCDTTHVNCLKRRKSMSASSQFVPTRLVDISGPPEKPMKIVETATTPVTGPYASLSHCWGLKEFVRLLPENKKTFMEEGVSWWRLPRNFQEAIEVARFLNIRYIWIDSLCIIQGKAGDFHLEASKMHQVYRNSYCNIAVVDSSDSTGGLFRQRDPNDVAPVRYEPAKESAMFGNKAWRVMSSNVWDSELLSSSLYVRGWVFQERMLAPRLLHFAKNQIFWDCPSMSACEGLPFGLLTPLDSVARPDRHWRGRLQIPDGNEKMLAGGIADSLGIFWEMAVQKYTSCALTNRRDKLIAMWGIAKLVRDVLDTEYGDGLWEEHLEHQLTWRVAQCTLHERPAESEEEDMARKIPSWSWASMDGRIIVPGRVTNKSHYAVKDHHGRPLAFDLVGVKRHLPPNPPKLGDQSSPTSSRGMSDSVAELRRRYRELEHDPQDAKAKSSQKKKHESKDTSRDAVPEFHSKSIPIQGYVVKGHLMPNRKRDGWSLKLDGLASEVEAYPDIIPRAEGLDPYFVVLSAKKEFALDAKGETKIAESDDETSREGMSSGADPTSWAFEISGAGILMKHVRDDHFQRTGAFSFRNVSAESFAKLQGNDQVEEGSLDGHRDKPGQMFWLD